MISAIDMRKYCIKTAFFICMCVSVLLFMTSASKAGDRITTEQSLVPFLNVTDTVQNAEKSDINENTVPQENTQPGTQQIVSDYLQAVRQKDAHKIWQFLSEDYKSDYRSPNEALRKLKTKKKLLHDHISFSWLETVNQEKNVIEKIELVTRNGGRALAFFRLERSADSVWKVDHITVLETDSKAI